MSLVRSISRTLPLTVVLVAMLGCTAGTDEVQKWVVAEKAKKGQPLDKPPEIKEFDTFVYRLKAPDDRDPFNVPMTEKEDQAQGSGPRPDKNRVREPLESFPLDGLKMVGTLGASTSPEGLLKDPEGVIRRVKPGDYVGQNYGRITAVNESLIELVEIVPNDTGGWAERQTTIALADANKK